MAFTLADREDVVMPHDHHYAPAAKKLAEIIDDWFVANGPTLLTEIRDTFPNQTITVPQAKGILYEWFKSRSIRSTLPL